MSLFDALGFDPEQPLSTEQLHAIAEQAIRDSSSTPQQLKDGVVPESTSELIKIIRLQLAAQKKCLDSGDCACNGLLATLTSVNTYPSTKVPQTWVSWSVLRSSVYVSVCSERVVLIAVA